VCTGFRAHSPLLYTACILRCSYFSAMCPTIIISKPFLSKSTSEEDEDVVALKKAEKGQNFP
jgi:hypothetical protein